MRDSFDSQWCSCYINSHDVVDPCQCHDELHSISLHCHTHDRLSDRVADSRWPCEAIQLQCRTVPVWLSNWPGLNNGPHEQNHRVLKRAIWLNHALGIHRACVWIFG